MGKYNVQMQEEVLKRHRFTCKRVRCWNKENFEKILRISEEKMPIVFEMNNTVNAIKWLGYV